MIIKINGSNNNINSVLSSNNSVIKKILNFTANISAPAPTPVYDNISPTITLNPLNINIEAFNGIYIDNSSNDIITDNSFSFNELTIDVCSNVITNVVGTYQVVYNVSDPCSNDASAVRTVNIIDTTPPVITLIGENPQTIYLDNSYSELGASALDIVDGSINIDICFGNLDTSLVGTYNVIYSALDTNGNYTSITRVINVNPKFTYQLDGSLAIINIYKNIGTLSNENLNNILTSNGWSDNLDLKIIGINNNTKWIDFQFLYSTHGKPNKLYIENISLESSIDGYAIYSRDTLLTMKDVDISGYSRANITDTGGGAIRIRSADYSSENPLHNVNNPTLSNVNITNCCRGIRIQDSISAYIYNCNVNNVTDNALYFAAGTYDSTSGCNNCIFDHCSAITSGQVAFMSIGGANNKFINCDMSGSRGSALGVWNTNGYIEVNNCTFTNANTIETTTPWGGNTDDFNGAAAGFIVANTDISGYLYIYDCSFNSGDGSVFYKAEPGIMEVSNNKINLLNFPDNILANQSFSIIGINQSKIITNPALIDYEIPSYYQAQSGGTITFPQPVNYYKAYCVPTSFANVLNYYNDPSGKNLALQLNYTSQNSHPPLTDFLYNYQGRPLTSTNISDLNKIDLGYMLNTNAHGFDLSNGSYTGTRLDNFYKFTEFMNLVSPSAQYRYYNKGFGNFNDISYAYSSVSGESLTPISYNVNEIDNVLDDIKLDISNSRPLILSFSHWNIVFNSSYETNGIIDISGESVYLYDFSGQVSSTLDIQNTNPLYNNPENIEETWDLDNGLGHTVTCVGYIENLNNKNWVIVQDNVQGTQKYVGVQLDASYLAMVTTLDLSPQGITPVTNLTCLAPDSSVNIINNNGIKYVFNNGSIYDSTLKYGLYNGTYVINNVPSGHPIAFLNNDVSNVISYSGNVSEGSSQVDGIDYNFYSGTVTLTVSGDFGTIGAYCYYHGYMGAENKFTYTTICNPNPFHSLSSNVSPLPSGYNGTIRLFDTGGGGSGLDFSFNEINNSIIEDPTKEVALYIENNEIKIKAINTLYDGRKLGSLMFNLYDELNNFIDANVTPQKINIIADNYVITPGNSYFLIQPAPGTPGENYLSITLAPQVIGAIAE